MRTNGARSSCDARDIAGSAVASGYAGNWVGDRHGAAGVETIKRAFGQKWLSNGMKALNENGGEVQNEREEIDEKGTSDEKNKNESKQSPSRAPLSLPCSIAER